MFVSQSRSQRNFPSNSYQQTLGESSSASGCTLTDTGIERGVCCINYSFVLRAKLLRTRDDDILDYNNIYLKLELGKQR